jgi:hypothetical protein
MWETVQTFVEKHHPSKAVAVRAMNLFNHSAMSYLREILKMRQEQVSYDRFLVKVADRLAGHINWRTAHKPPQRYFNVFNIFFYIRDRFFTENLLFLQFYVYNFYIYIQRITCIGNTKSRYRCTTCNISASDHVRATDPLY